jgi:hypothetical protein
MCGVGKMAITKLGGEKRFCRVISSGLVLSMLPFCQNISHIQAFFFPILSLKLKIGLQIGGRLL